MAVTIYSIRGHGGSVLLAQKNHQKTSLKSPF